MSKRRSAKDHARGERSINGSTLFSLAQTQQEERAAGGPSTIADQLAREAAAGIIPQGVAEFGSRVVESGNFGAYYSGPIPQPLLDREPYIGMAGEFHRQSIGASGPSPEMDAVSPAPARRERPHAGQQGSADLGRQK